MPSSSSRTARPPLPREIKVLVAAAFIIAIATLPLWAESIGTVPVMQLCANCSSSSRNMSLAGITRSSRLP